MPTREEQELQEAVECVLVSDSPRKLIVAGPGAGKTTLFKKLLERAGGARDDRLVLTFINGLKADLDRSLGDLAKVYTLHAYCQYLLHQHAALRGGLTNDFVCYPQLASLIKKDWEWIESSSPPKFVDLMRDLACSPEQEAFYLTRSTYYDAVDFDDSVYQVYRRLTNSPHLLPAYDLVLIDEFQDFNRMEAAIIELLAQRSSIVVAGDDDQALYSQLRRASWDHIREHYLGGEYEVFHLPFCMRCPEVVVAAFGDVIENAKAAGKLQGRIDKPYRYFAPAKGEDSKRYPTIDLVSTSVQRQNANYFGRYIEKAIRGIGEAEFAQAAANHESAVLVIGARPLT